MKNRKYLFAAGMALAIFASIVLVKILTVVRRDAARAEYSQKCLKVQEAIDEYAAGRKHSLQSIQDLQVGGFLKKGEFLQECLPANYYQITDSPDAGIPGLDVQ